jgi:hypothetical protein
MSTQPVTAPPAISWRHRALRRTTAGLGAAVVLAAVGPALANAAGADVANPVAVVLRASGEELQDVLGGDDEAGVVAGPCVTPTASEEPTEEPAEPSVEPNAEPSAEVSAEPTLDAADPSGEPDEGTDEGTDPSAEPTAEPAPEPTGGAVEEPADDCAAPEETASPTEQPAEETDDADDAGGEHGRIVSTVAQCAPRGKDPLLDVEGAPANHGGYVQRAAHGDTLTTPWGEFDLATQAGADALCASLDGARAALPEETAEPKRHGKPDKAKHAKHAKAKPPKAKPAKAGKGAKHHAT